HDPGQQPGRSHVGAGETDLAEKKCDLGGLSRDAYVTRRGDHGARTGHSAVQGGYDRTPATADGQDEIAGEPGELEQTLVVPGEKGSDDVFDGSPGAKGGPV